MTFALRTTAIFLLSSSAAFAGPVEVPAPPPPVILAADDPFEGFYVGLEYGHSTPSVAEAAVAPGANLTGDIGILDGTAWGGFAGYNYQNGAMIIGGEVRILHLNAELSPFPLNNELTQVIDARARLGYALNDRIMAYGAVGYSTAELYLQFFDDTTNLTGFNAGLGAEFNATDSIFLGVDYTYRDLTGGLGGFEYEAEVNTLTLRAGFRF